MTRLTEDDLTWAQELWSKSDRDYEQLKIMSELLAISIDEANTLFKMKTRRQKATEKRPRGARPDEFMCNPRGLIWVTRKIANDLEAARRKKGYTIKSCCKAVASYPQIISSNGKKHIQRQTLKRIMDFLEIDVYKYIPFDNSIDMNAPFGHSEMLRFYGLSFTVLSECVKMGLPCSQVDGRGRLYTVAETDKWLKENGYSEWLDSCTAERFAVEMGFAPGEVTSLLNRGLPTVKLYKKRRIDIQAAREWLKQRGIRCEGRL